MKLTITYIRLKGSLKFFALSYKAMGILNQLKATNCVGMKKQGIWKDHYTMTLWHSEEDLKAFARSGAHLKAMKESQSIASEIKTLTIDATEFPSWEEAKALLKNVVPIVYPD